MAIIEKSVGFHKTFTNGGTLTMARFTLPRDVYHGKGALENLKALKGKRLLSLSAAAL